MSLDLLQHCWFLVGPTAVGKTEIGLQLAEELSAEIVALDSMTVYREMDIGTAKPTREQRQRVPHHLIDLIEPHEEYSVAEYVSAAETVCADLLSRGRIPLFVGGTGLYLRSLLRGVESGPPADWELRQRLQQQAEEKGTGFLHRQLMQWDPVTARRVHPHDLRRIIRALEVLQITGRPLSELQHHSPLPPELRPQHVFWLAPPRDWLYERINRRVERMVRAGLVEEVRHLLNRQPPAGRTARQALGYKEMMEHLAGGASLATAIEQIQTRTRQFAKRQHTWFRQLEECRRIDLTGTESVEALLRRLLQQAC